MLRRMTELKDKSEVLFKVSKNVCQASTTNACEVQNLMDALEKFCKVPAQFHACMVKFLVCDAVKFNKLDILAEIMEAGGIWQQKLEAGGYTQDVAENFLSGQFEEMASKVMRAITSKEVEGADGAGGKLSYIPTLPFE